MSQTLFIKPNKNWSLFATVGEGSPSAVDPDHQLSWLVDGRPGFPLRITGGSAAITITSTSPISPDIVAICHHLLDERLVVSVSGDVSGGSVVIPDYPANGVPYNAWDLVTPVSPVGDVTLTITGNSGDIVIGEVVIGESTVLDPSLRIADTRFGRRRYLNGPHSDLSGIPPYSERASTRPLSGSQYYSAAMLAEILDWFDSEDGYAYPVPSLLIPDSDDPTDARLVRFANEPRWARVGPEGSDVEFLVELDFHEYVRGRW